MAVKPLDKKIGQPTTNSMNIMTEQMSKLVSAVKTTARGGKHVYLALVLHEGNYRTFTRCAEATIARLTNPAPVNKEITAFSTPFETLILQEKQKFNKAAYKL